MSDRNALLRALAADNPLALTALGQKWGVVLTMNEYGHRRYWQLVVDLAKYVTRDDTPGEWYTDCHVGVVHNESEGGNE